MPPISPLPPTMPAPDRSTPPVEPAPTMPTVPVPTGPGSTAPTEPTSTVPTVPSTLPEGDPGAITAKEIVSAATNSTATLRDIADTDAAVDAMKGIQLVALHYDDPSLPVGDPAKAGTSVASTSGFVAPGAIFDKLPEALAMAIRGAADLRGTIPAQGSNTPLAPSNIVARLGDRFALLQGTLAQAPTTPHPLTAEFSAPGSTPAAAAPTGTTDGFQSRTPLSASSFTAIDPRVVAVIDGLGNLVPQIVEPTPTPTPTP
ncbi:MAG: hypothetical protein ABI200_00145, partial [Gaiellales bacterium]